MMHIILFFFLLVTNCQKSKCPAGFIQPQLRYNSSNQVPQFPYQQDTLADEVCCADFGFPLAEPKNFFATPGALVQNLHKYIDSKGEITFYDSVCGLPLFRVPQKRTLQDFIVESTKHGWPSFHEEEAIQENLIIKQTNVYSKCGTFLGTLEPFKSSSQDSKSRYCIDLVCISGNPVQKTLGTSAGAYLVTFDPNNKSTYFSWTVTNDPVMGGRSSSTFSIQRNSGIFNGTVRIVPSLKAPGFCNARTAGWFNKFNDISTFTHIMILARTTTPQYLGFKISICADTILPCQFYSYKSNFNVTPGSDYSWISIPYSDFSNDWSSYTGDCNTVDPNGKQHYCCSGNGQGLKPTKNSVCMTQQNLAAGVKEVGLWSEGAAGEFHLDVLAIGAGTGSKNGPAVMLHRMGI